MLTLAKSVMVEMELKRLVTAIYSGNERVFNYFENDVFILFDPFDDEEEEIEEEQDEELVDEEPFEKNVIDSSFFSCEDTQPVVQYFYDDDDEPDLEINYGKANFHHKPTDVKLWWKLGDGMIYSNKTIKPRQISNIMNQCILSLGRRSARYLNTERTL
jgi:hypothetical protein